jgi:60 kDa SS-A/Ro ribonucleoprotein
MARAYANYTTNVTATLQSQPIPGRETEMVANNAGGYGFALDDWERLNRFLIIGSESGTYYVGEQKLTAQNAATAIRCIKADGVRAVKLAQDINVNNRAPKTDQQLFLLALALKHGDADTKAAAEAAVPFMVRTGTHLLHFAAMLDGLGGWNRTKRRIVGGWLTRADADRAAFQMLKYQNRDGWTMRDILRVTHPTAPTPEHDAAFAWAANKLTEDKAANLPSVLRDHRAMLANGNDAVTQALWGWSKGLPREALPTEAINTPAVQAAMLSDMPLHALIRNLGNLSASGVLANGSKEAAAVAARLTDHAALRKSRVHPFAILLAALVYQTGHGVRGGKTWAVNPVIVAALEDAYDAAFASVTPTGKCILVAIDISGSMADACMGTPIAASTAAGAMAITLARLEPHALVVHFDVAVQRIVPVTRRTAISGLGLTTGGGTDVGAPVRWALGEATNDAYSRLWGGSFGHVGQPATQAPAQRQEFDAFVILTDNETWTGRAHCSELLERYRREVNRNARLVCCAMAAGHGNVVDPADPLSFGCAGLDASLPALVGDFIGR